MCELQELVQHYERDLATNTKGREDEAGGETRKSSGWDRY